MRRRLRTVIAAVSVVAVFAVPLAGQASAEGHDRSHLRAWLTGEKEVPGPGDSDGWGRAQVWVDPWDEEVCFHLEWRKIEGPVAAHIHRGGPAVAGPVKVLLFETSAPLPPSIHAVAGCVDADKELLKRIAAHPRRFYVNVHNVPYPDGAIRGQLFKPSH